MITPIGEPPPDESPVAAAGTSDVTAVEVAEPADVADDAAGVVVLEADVLGLRADPRLASVGLAGAREPPAGDEPGGTAAREPAVAVAGIGRCVRGLAGGGAARLPPGRWLVVGARLAGGAVAVSWQIEVYVSPGGTLVEPGWYAHASTDPAVGFVDAAPSPL